MAKRIGSQNRTTTTKESYPYKLGNSLKGDIWLLWLLIYDLSRIVCVSGKKHPHFLLFYPLIAQSTHNFVNTHNSKETPLGSHKHFPTRRNPRTHQEQYVGTGCQWTTPFEPWSPSDVHFFCTFVVILSSLFSSTSEWIKWFYHHTWYTAAWRKGSKKIQRTVIVPNPKGKEKRENDGWNY